MREKLHFSLESSPLLSPLGLVEVCPSTRRFSPPPWRPSPLSWRRFPFLSFPSIGVLYCPPNSPPPPFPHLHHRNPSDPNPQTHLTSLRCNTTIRDVAPLSIVFCWLEPPPSLRSSDPAPSLSQWRPAPPSPSHHILMTTSSRPPPEPPPSKRNRWLIVDRFLLDLRFLFIANTSSQFKLRPPSLSISAGTKGKTQTPLHATLDPLSCLKNYPPPEPPSCRPPPKPNWVQPLPSVFVNVYVVVVFPFLVVVWLMKDAGTASLF